MTTIKKKYIKIRKGFLKNLKLSIKMPTIKCPICGKKILDTPTNRINNLPTPKHKRR